MNYEWKGGGGCPFCLALFALSAGVVWGGKYLERFQKHVGEWTYYYFY